MRLIVISSEKEIAGEAEIMNSLFNAGLTCLHLRKPLSNVQEICKLLNGIDPVYYNRIALHQHHYLAEAYNIVHLHYTEKARAQLAPGIPELQRNRGYLLSTSVHAPDRIAEMDNFDYVFFGPVFNSLSKPGYKSSIPPGFKLVKEKPVPAVIALGGIGLQQLPAVKAIGFDGAAVLGALWNEPGKALHAFKQLQENMPRKAL